MKESEQQNRIDSGDIDEIREFYDSVYYADATVNGEVESRGHYRQLARKSNIELGSEVLDVACGKGDWLRVCTEVGATVCGIDLSGTAISICRKTMPAGEFYTQAAESLPFEDRRFDVVTCLGSLEHFVDPVNGLMEMSRVAKADATIIILVPNKDFLTRKLGLFGGTYQVDAKEVVRTLDDWEALFLAAGLLVEERWKDLHVLNMRWITTGRFYMWPFRALQCLLLMVWPLRWQYQVYHRCVRK